MCGKFMCQTECIVLISQLLHIGSCLALIHRPVSVTVLDQPVFDHRTVYRLTSVAEIIGDVHF